MSRESRAALAAAASSVDGIDVEPQYRQRMRQGSGWVRLDRIEYPDPFGGVAWWDVVVVCPQDQERAAVFMDEHVGALVEALGEEMTVTGVVPYAVDLAEVGRVPGFIIEGHRAY